MANWNNEGWEISNYPPHRDDFKIIICYCWTSIKSITNSFNRDMPDINSLSDPYIVAIFKITKIK